MIRAHIARPAESTVRMDHLLRLVVIEEFLASLRALGECEERSRAAFARLGGRQRMTALSATEVQQ